MDAREIDWRYDWISLTLDALESGFETIQKRGEEEPWFDGGWQLENGEGIFGIAFVAAQTYISGTTEDINGIRKSNGKNRRDKIDYYSDDLEELPGQISRILLINSIANYFKHHDEWNGWPDRADTRILAGVGIDGSTMFPCNKVAEKLLGEKAFENLEGLLSIIAGWREYIISKYK